MSLRNVQVLAFLKDDVGLTPNDFRGNDNEAIRSAAENGHVNVLAFLKDNIDLTAEDFRVKDNEAIRTAIKNGHTHVLEFLKEKVGLTTDEFRTTADHFSDAKSDTMLPYRIESCDSTTFF